MALVILDHCPDPRGTVERPITVFTKETSSKGVRALYAKPYIATWTATAKALSSRV